MAYANKNNVNISSNISDLFSDLINKSTEEKATSKNYEEENYNPHGWIDIIEFCESPYYLNLNLYPWQRLILKLFYMGSDGNKHLKINENESGCLNCIWHKNRLRGESKCLLCSNYPTDNFEQDIQEIKNKMWLHKDRVKEIQETEKTNLFQNEMQLLKSDLIQDSDSATGGSVQKQVIDKIGGFFSELLLVLGRRSGKALAIDTPIPTPEGWKTMEDIKPGDYVFGMDGAPAKVLSATEIMKDRPCYEIKFSNGEKIICDEEHSWLTLEKMTSQLQKLSTLEIMNSIKKGQDHAVPLCQPVDYSEKKLPTDPYIFGVLIGDSNKNSNLYENNIPKIYLESSISQRLNLLQGLMDSNGYINKDGNYEFRQSNKRIAEQVLELVCSLGMKATLIEINNTSDRKVTPKQYKVCFDQSKLKVFKLSRELNNQQKSYNGRVFIESIEKIESVPVKCIQVHNENNTYLCGKTFIPTHNSMIVSIIALYESYKVIEMGNPQAIFGNLNEGDTITILNVAVSEQQAKESVFDKIKPMIMNSAYFKSKISPNSLQNRSVRFLTPRDEQNNKDLANEGLPSREGSIYLLSGHSNSDSLVGKNVLVVIIDEMASMVGKDGSKMSDEELYTKLKHSLWTFGQNGKIICISNPLTKDGKFFELYEQSFTDDRILMIQLPSYKVNPTLDKQALDAERNAAQKAGQYEQYQMQIEARFSGGAADPFIPSEFIDVAFEKGSHRRRAERGNPNLLYYMHLDPANNSDNYAMVILHIEEDPLLLDVDKKPSKIVIIDHINMWMPSETGEPVNISEVDEYVIRMTRNFNIVSISYDMWESAASSQLLQRMGLPAKVTAFSSSYKQQIYSTLRNIFYERRIEFYGLDGFSPDSNSDTYGYVLEAADQFKFLSRRFNRSSFSIKSAPGHFDDIPDCIAGAAFMALTNQHGYSILPKSRLVRMQGFH